MATGRPIGLSPRQFDDAKLQAMMEPLTVRIDRLSGGKRTPMGCWPSASGEEGGKGFTKDEIRDLETTLITQWSGGGLYEVSVTDSSEPAINMKWQPWWDPRIYPEAIPPNLETALSPDAMNANVKPPPQGVRMPPSFFPQPPFTAPTQAGYPMPAPPPVGSPHYQAWVGEVDRREEREELRRLRTKVEDRERESREQAHRVDLERERAANNERFRGLETMIANLANSIKEAAQPKGPSPEVIALQAQLAEQREASRRAEERAEATRREQEADRRETAMKDMIRLQGEQAQRAFEQTQRQIEQMQQQFQTTIANLTTQLASNANKADPLITLMIESAKTSADALKTMASENRQAIEKVQSLVMNPRDLLAIAKESAEGTEKVVERTTRMTDAVLSMQNRVLETAISVQPGGSPVVEAVRDGMTNLKEFAERLVGGKSREAIATVQANAEMAKAQAHVIEVQARMANPGAFVGQPSLSGAAIPQPPVSAEFTPPPPPAATSTEVNAAAQPTKPARVERLWGRTDDEWFGPALGEVIKLRADVGTFITNTIALHSAGKMPERIEDIPGANPAGVAVGVLMATAEAQRRSVNIPAMTELLMQGMLAEFTSVLLPDASPEYKAEVAKFLANPPGTEPEEEDDPDDEDGDENEQPAQAAPAAASAQPQNQRRGNGSRRHAS